MKENKNLNYLPSHFRSKWWAIFHNKDQHPAGPLKKTFGKMDLLEAIIDICTEGPECKSPSLAETLICFYDSTFYSVVTFVVGTFLAICGVLYKLLGPAGLKRQSQIVDAAYRLIMCCGKCRTECKWLGLAKEQLLMKASNLLVQSVWATYADEAFNTAIGAEEPLTSRRFRKLLATAREKTAEKIEKGHDPAEAIGEFSVFTAVLHKLSLLDPKCPHKPLKEAIAPALDTDEEKELVTEAVDERIVPMLDALAEAVQEAKRASERMRPEVSIKMPSSETSTSSASSSSATEKKLRKKQKKAAKKEKRKLRRSLRNKDASDAKKGLSAAEDKS